MTWNFDEYFHENPFNTNIPRIFFVHLSLGVHDQGETLLASKQYHFQIPMVSKKFYKAFLVKFSSYIFARILQYVQMMNFLLQICHQLFRFLVCSGGMCH